MRNRQRDLSAPSIPHSGDVWSQSYNNATESVIQEVDQTIDSLSFPSTFVQTTNDIEIDRFHERRAKGEIFNNPYDTIKTETKEVPLHIRGNLHFSNDLINGTSWRRNFPPSGLDIGLVHRFSLLDSLLAPSWTLDTYTDEQTLALTRAFAQLNDPTALLAVTIGEGKKTVTMLSSIARTMFKVARLIKRGISLKRQILSAADKATAKQAASAYLQVRYGLRPLYYEVNGYLEAISKWGRDPIRTRFRAFEKGSKYEFNVASTTVQLQEAYLDIELQTDKVTQFVVSGGVLCEALRYHKTQAEQLGLTSPLSTVWELIPFSFIVDWFVNTSDLFASFEPHVGLEPITWWNSVVETTTFTTRVKSIVPNGPADLVGSDLHWDGGTVTTIIDRRFRIPIPARQILPIVNFRLSAGKVVDLLALSANSINTQSELLRGVARF